MAGRHVVLFARISVDDEQEGVDGDDLLPFHERINFYQKAVREKTATNETLSHSRSNSSGSAQMLSVAPDNRSPRHMTPEEIRECTSVCIDRRSCL